MNRQDMRVLSTISKRRQIGIELVGARSAEHTFLVRWTANVHDADNPAAGSGACAPNIHLRKTDITAIR